MTTSKERYDAASTALGTAIDTVKAKVTATAAASTELSTVQTAKAALETELAKVKSDFEAYKANAEQELNKAYDTVSSWAEGITKDLAAHL